MPRVFKISLAAAFFLVGCFRSDSGKNPEAIQTAVRKQGSIILSGFCIAPPKDAIFGRRISALSGSENLVLEVHTKGRPAHGSGKKADKFYTFQAPDRRGALFVGPEDGKEVVASIELSPPWKLLLTENTELSSDLAVSEMKKKLASKGAMSADDGNIRYIDPLGIEINITIVGERALLISAAPTS